MTSRCFVAFCRKQDDSASPSRFGFTVPKALGKAVKRNRIKRRMREAVRAHLDDLSTEWAIVFNPRRAVLDAPFEEVCQEVGRIFARCSQS
jgi:ribonuclease P protein component